MLMSKTIKELEKALSPKNVLKELEERYAYSEDASNAPHGIPDVVVFAETIEQVQEVVKIANEAKIPVICRGAGTNTVGSCLTQHGGIILNFAKIHFEVK